jgi:hypothetical protein
MRVGRFPEQNERRACGLSQSRDRDVHAGARPGNIASASAPLHGKRKNMKKHLASAIVAAGLLALASSQAFAWTCVADNSNPRAGFRAGTGSGTGSSEAEARQRALRDCTELRGPGCRIAWCRRDGSAPRDPAGGTRLPQVDRSTSSSPDTRFWRFIRDDGSCAVYVHRQTAQRRTLCDY